MTIAELGKATSGATGVTIVGATFEHFVVKMAVASAIAAQ